MERNECFNGKTGLQSSLKGKKKKRNRKGKKKKRREKEKERKKNHPRVSSKRQMRQTCLPSLIGMV